MSIDLSAYSSVETALFTTIDVPDYEVLTFSTYHRGITFNGVNYIGLGEFLSITESTSELRITPTELTITISGIPNGNISEILNQNFKGATIDIIRGFFDATTGNLLPIPGNPVGKFQGIINNYALNEDWSGVDATNTISLICTSTVGLLNNKIAGRRTNPIDQKLFYPSDVSMDRVPSLANSNFNFGAVVR